MWLRESSLRAFTWCASRFLAPTGRLFRHFHPFVDHHDLSQSRPGDTSPPRTWIAMWCPGTTSVCERVRGWCRPVGAALARVVERWIAPRNTKSPRLNYFSVLISLAHNTKVLDFFAIETVRTRNDAYHPWRTETGYARLAVEHTWSTWWFESST